jgi:nicotinamidase/pyrazinamidase
MSAKKYFVITLAAFIVILGVFVIVVMKKMLTPTQGQKIVTYADPQKALLVIDVQEDFTGLKGRQPVPYRGVEPQIMTINDLIDRAAKAGLKVVYIRNLYDDNFVTRLILGRDIEGKPGTEMDARIKMINQNDFTKKISDAFSNPRLDEFMITNQVNELYLVGLDAAYCVYNTAKGALNRGYRVTIVKDAIMTRKNMSDVLKRYEKEGIVSTSSREIGGI